MDVNLSTFALKNAQEILKNMFKHKGNFYELYANVNGIMSVNMYAECANTHIDYTSKHNMSVIKQIVTAIRH
jgi:hypothetical protein